MRTYLFIDPGESTGYVVSDELGNIEDIGTIGLESFYDEMYKLILTLNGLSKHVIIESFQLYPWKAKNKSWSSFPEVENIGVIKFICHLQGIEVITQKPAQKDTFNNKIVKSICGKDMLASGSVTRHSFDAVRHLLVFFTSKKMKEENVNGYNNIIEQIKDSLRRI